MIYLNIGNDAAKVINNAGCIFFTVLFLMFTAMMPTILTCKLQFILGKSIEYIKFFKIQFHFQYIIIIKKKTTQEFYTIIRYLGLYIMYIAILLMQNCICEPQNGTAECRGCYKTQTLNTVYSQIFSIHSFRILNLLPKYIKQKWRIAVFLFNLRYRLF